MDARPEGHGPGCQGDGAQRAEPEESGGMSFLLGLLIGGILFSDGTHAPGMMMLSQIPVRCLVLFEKDEQAYRVCRHPSLRYELYGQSMRSDGNRECALPSSWQ